MGESEWTQVPKGAKWVWPGLQRPDESSSVQCLTCGHTVTLEQGESIPYGDPRLCEHWGQKP